MGSVGDILSGLRQVVLLQENISRLQQDVQLVAQDLKRLRDYTGEIDRRVARIEGVMEGYRRGAEDALGRLPSA